MRMRLLFCVPALLLTACAVAPPAPPAPAEPGMIAIPGGRFTMGWDDGQINQRPEHAVVLDAFAIDRCEVSAREFAEFLNLQGNPEGRYFTLDEFSTIARLPGDGGSDRGRYAPRAGLENYPANNVSWHGADAYCRWKGGWLPTEAEWEKAARGRDERLFPWGKRSPDAETARFAQVWEGRQFGVLVPVDALPAGASYYGLRNMSGNVLEWVSDWYRQNLCDFCHPEREANLSLIGKLSGLEDRPEAGATPGRQAPPRENPTGPFSGTFKVLRGGSWSDRKSADLYATNRFWLDPAQRFPQTGFRCAK